MGNGQIDRRAFLGAGAAGCAGLILGTTRAWTPWDMAGRDLGGWDVGS